MPIIVLPFVNSALAARVPFAAASRNCAVNTSTSCSAPVASNPTSLTQATSSLRATHGSRHSPKLSASLPLLPPGHEHRQVPTVRHPGLILRWLTCVSSIAPITSPPRGGRAGRLIQARSPRTGAPRPSRRGVPGRPVEQPLRPVRRPVPGMLGDSPPVAPGQLADHAETYLPACSHGSGRAKHGRSSPSSSSRFRPSPAPILTAAAASDFVVVTHMIARRLPHAGPIR